MFTNSTYDLLDFEQFRSYLNYNRKYTHDKNDNLDLIHLVDVQIERIATQQWPLHERQAFRHSASATRFVQLLQESRYLTSQFQDST